MRTKALLFEPGKKPKTVRINFLDEGELQEKIDSLGVGYLVGFPDPKLFAVIGVGLYKPQKACKVLAGYMVVHGPILVGYSDSPCANQGPPSRTVDLPDDVIAELHKWMEDVPAFLASRLGTNWG